MQGSGERQKLEVIDVLRGIAILSVFGYHWHISQVDRYVQHNGRVMMFQDVTWDNLYASFSPLNYGSYGVELFLVISGFLIHYNYLIRGAGRLNLNHYFSRRFWRIYPPYILVLFFFAFLNKERSAYHLFTETGRESLLCHLLMVHNLYRDNAIIFGINSSFWSIALEIQLYLIYPIFLILRRKIGVYKLCFTLFIVHVLALIGIYIWRSGFPHSLAEVTFVGHFWIIWGLGAMVAEAWFARQKIFKISWTGWFILFLIFMSSQIFLLFFVYAGSIMSAILWAALIELCLYQPLRLNVFFRYVKSFLIPVGLCSYSIYLIHQPLIEPLLQHVNWGDSSRYTSLINIGWVFSVIFLISYSLYVFVEQPSIRFGQKIAGTSRAK